MTRPSARVTKAGQARLSIRNGSGPGAILRRQKKCRISAISVAAPAAAINTAGQPTQPALSARPGISAIATPGPETRQRSSAKWKRGDAIPCNPRASLIGISFRLAEIRKQFINFDLIRRHCAGPREQGREEPVASGRQDRDGLGDTPALGFCQESVDTFPIFTPEQRAGGIEDAPILAGKARGLLEKPVLHRQQLL